MLYYSLVPSEKIIALLKPLEIDLLLNDALDLDFYAKRKEAIYLYYQKLLFQLKERLQNSILNDAKIEYVFEEHFKNQRPISSLSPSLEERDEFLRIKKKIISSAYSLDNCLIKKTPTNEVKIMEHV